MFHFSNFLCRLDSNKRSYWIYLQTGFFHLPHGDFFIEPVKKHPLTEEGYHPHVVYRSPETKEPTCGLKGIVTSTSSYIRRVRVLIFFFLSLTSSARSDRCDCSPQRFRGLRHEDP